MKIEITHFRGEMPMLASHRLPPEYAEYAYNCRYEGGDLQPRYGMAQDVAGSAQLRTGGDVKSIFPYGDGAFWFSWLNEVDAVNSPIADDPYDRVYYTGEADGIVRLTSNLIATGSSPYPAAFHFLGVPAPASAPTPTVNYGLDDEDPATDESRAYVMTYVTEYGEEGPPSAASSIVTLNDPSVDTVSLSLPILNPNYHNVTHKRIYRTQTSGGDTSFYFVAEVPLATATYLDGLEADQLGDVISTEEYVGPPVGMKGLCAGSNGMLAGYYKNEFIVCEPYLPYAWPLRYRRSLNYDIRAIMPISTGFVIGTSGHPYVMSGVHPDALSDRKLELNQACMGWRSMVDMGDYVIYASPDGLVGVSETQAQLLTKDIIDRRTWQAEFAPALIRGCRYEDKYLGYGNGTPFIYDLTNNAITRIGLDDITAAHNDLLTDTLWLVDDDRNLYTFDSDAQNLPPYTWRSKEFQTPDTTFAVLKVWTTQPDLVGVKITADGYTVFERSSLPQEAMKIPPARGTRWQVELTGVGVVQRVALAQSMSEVG
ncbi:MAG: hypothetical protein CME59_22645 [Halioglobus sp.]|nr:hypothetical protein [Halioglobus sp.]|tara:strand:+ start:796 stop:2415 length:1620 start_codon:yes stop_codon:yes gene_type:complete